MARSKAKKKRNKFAREGRRNPEDNRSPFALTDMRTRRTKTKKEKLYQNKHKNHPIHDAEKDGFFICVADYPSSQTALMSLITCSASSHVWTDAPAANGWPPPLYFIAILLMTGPLDLNRTRI